MGVIDMIKAGIHNEASEWRVSPATVKTLIVLPFAGAILVAASRVNKPLFDFLTREDSVIEWLQFFGFVMAAVIGIMIARKLWQQDYRLAAAAYVVFALGCVFVAGEEISWGQRILGLETPESLAAINKQNEITLHNIDFVQRTFNLLLVLIGFFGSFSVWLVRWASAGRLRPGAALFIPPVFLTSFFLMVFVYRFTRFSLLPDSSYTITRFGEWTELCLAAGLACFALLVWRRLCVPADDIHPANAAKALRRKSYTLKANVDETV